MNNFDKYFVFFSTCITVKGYSRSLIIDLQRRNFITIPNSMYEMIELFNSKKSIEEIIKIYGIENSSIIEEYLTFLIEEEYGILTDMYEFDNFPPISKEFETPSIITNSIIEVSQITVENLPKIVKSLNDFNCKDIQFISYEVIDLKSLELILSETNDSDFKSIQLLLKYSKELFEYLPNIHLLNKRITDIIFHSADDENNAPTIYDFNVTLNLSSIKNFSFCGIINTDYFNIINKERVLESINFNSCLYKKISIDSDGNIKNCPATKNIFGNIKNTSLQEAIKKDRFEDFWYIKKDQINICKDCEFRHVCTDCRAFLENPNDIYSKPLKCGYNPYESTWEEWSSNPLKNETITYYGIEKEIN